MTPKAPESSGPDVREKLSGRNAETTGSARGPDGAGGPQWAGRMGLAGWGWPSGADMMGLVQWADPMGLARWGWPDGAGPVGWLDRAGPVRLMR